MDSSPLDYVAQACIDLGEALRNQEPNDTEREAIIINHIKKVYNNVSPVEDFKKSVDWFNVSEPLSLSQHCFEKVVVLDFWTYCCINCFHVLPDLAFIEKQYSVKDGLVVIGVHCAKFSNEKEAANVSFAVERYGIKHAVVNDPDSYTWDALGIRCWPTLVILGPGNKPLFILTGEGHKDELDWFVGATLKHFASNISSNPVPISISKHIKSSNDSVLHFPSKVALNPFYRGRPDEPFLAISDTGHHRVLLTDCSGQVLRMIGGLEPGFQDGKMNEARLNSPQGLCWLSNRVVVVCDTGNHCLRTLHLDTGTVEVLAGCGKQSEHGDNGGKCLGMQPMSSPWDVVLFSTPDMDMSVRAAIPPPLVPPAATPITTTTPNETKDNPQVNTPPPPPPTPPSNDSEKGKKDEKRRVLLIANAGSHQIWALFLDTTIWWKYKNFSEGTCVCVAGSGAEAARNSTYPMTAAFAQPSGLAIKTGSTPEVFVADSESSSIRKLSLSTGQVTTLVGGDRNPLNLFAFGDVDEVGMEAKLQHPLAVAYCESTKALFIADTYNHKIKKANVSSQRVTTMYPSMMESLDPATFNEPSGLAVTADGKYLYIADTNNHSIKILNISKNICEEFQVRLPEPKFNEPDNLILYKNDLFVNRKCGHLIIYFNVALDPFEAKNVNFTPGAPQNWNISIRDEKSTDVTLEDFEFINSSNKGSVLPDRVEMKLKQRTDKTHYRLYLSFQTALCDGAVCFSHAFTIRSTMLVRDSVKMTESYKITCKVNPINRSNSATK